MIIFVLQSANTSLSFCSHSATRSTSFGTNDLVPFSKSTPQPTRYLTRTRQSTHSMSRVFKRFFQGSSPSIPFVTPEEAVSIVRSKTTVFVHGAAMTPTTLIKALAARAGPQLADVSVVSIHLEGVNELAQPPAAVSFRPNCCFVGGNTRLAVKEGRADYTPCFLSEIPTFFRKRVIPVDTAMVQVSPPDRHGYCSLGTSIDVAVAACESAKQIIAQINPQVPRTHGDGLLHISQITKAVSVDKPIAKPGPPEELSKIFMDIGQNVASLIPDGATIQAGIGGVPDAALAAMTSHRDLGVHTEMFSDGLLRLIESGSINNSKKVVQRGKIVTSFAGGSQALIDFVHDNPDVLFLECSFVNDPHTIRQNPKVAAINSAVEIDITGQAVSDSIGKTIYSGVGGQMDFIRGASLSEGGKPILALPARTEKGVPRIVPTIKPGAGVVTTRAHVHYIVTEYGIAELHGKSLRARAQALVGIAHPDDREALERETIERYYPEIKGGGPRKA